MIRSCYEGKWRSEPLGLAKASGGSYIRSNILTAGMAKTAMFLIPERGVEVGSKRSREDSFPPTISTRR
jgi:hypothetical protein